MNNHIVTIMATEHDGSNTRNIAINLNILDENPGNFDIKDAVRKAVHEYLCTEEGRKTYDYNCGCFNWADFETNVPNEICRRYGFKKIKLFTDTIDVDWDEQLADDDALNDFWHKDDEE